MNFYFCETCGKRLTEKQINQGEAKNKKLKGVYCNGCSVGVMTMETLPMSEEDAKAVLADVSTDQVERSLRHQPQKKESRSNHQKRGAQGQDHAQPPRTPATSNTTLYLICAAIAACILGGVFLSSPTRQPEKKKSRRPTSTPKATHQSSAPVPPPTKNRTAQHADQDKQSADNVSPQQEPSNEAVAQEAFKLLIRFDGISADDLSARAAKVDAFLSQYGKTLTAARARNLLQQLRQPAPPNNPIEKRNTPSKLQTPIEKKTPASVKTADLKVIVKKIAAPKPKSHELAFDKHFDALVAACTARDLSSARQAAEKAATDATLGPWSSATKRIPAVVKVMLKREKIKQEVWKGLKGKTVDLYTTKGRRKGVVIDVQANALTLETRYKINGKEKSGAAFLVPRSDLLTKTLSRIFPKWTPASGDEWAARMLEQMAASNLDDAATTRTQLINDPLHAPLNRGLMRLLDARNERRATKAWQVFIKQIGETLDEDEAERLVNILDLFEEKFGNTKAADIVTTERKKLRDRLEQASNIFEKKLQRIFKSKVTVHDRKTLHITLNSTFNKNPTHVADWGGLDPPYASFEKNELRLGSQRGKGTYYGNLINRCFDTHKLALEFAYTLHNGGGAVVIHFGLPEENDDSEDAKSLKVSFGPTRTTNLSLQKRKMLYSSKSTIPHHGNIKIDIELEAFSIQLDEKPHLSCTLPKTFVRRPGIAFAVRAFMKFDLHSLRVTGHLNPDWLKQQFEKLKSSESPSK